MILKKIIKRQPSRIINDWTWDAEPGEKVIYRNWPCYLRESTGINKRLSGELYPQQVKSPYGKIGDIIFIKKYSNIKFKIKDIYIKKLNNKWTWIINLEKQRA